MPQVEIVIKDSTLKNIIIFSIIAISIAGVAFINSPFLLPSIFSLWLILWAAYYSYSHRNRLSEMCCMMSGMTFGLVSGFFIGTLVALMTADFLVGIVGGTIAGLIFGMPLGRMGAGGHLGRMEGVMAGPMGGIMGGMLGVMIRFYNLELFMPFFIFIVILTAWEMVYAVNRDVKGKTPTNMFYLGILLSFLAMGSAIIPDYKSVEAGGTFPTIFAVKTQEAKIQNDNVLVKDGVQEVTIKAERLGYTPNYLTVKNNIPVRINLKASQDAGCTRSFVLPSFGIKKLLQPGGSDTIEFTPQKAGTYQFRCSMAMAAGTMVVV